ncbi:MAG: hypothetical protein ABSF28_13025 [Terracidiphilus sp.]|jgi:hypothetical protein
MTQDEYERWAATLNTSPYPRITNAVPLPTNKTELKGWTTDVAGVIAADPIPEPTDEECEEGLSIKQMKAIGFLIEGYTKIRTAACVDVSRRTISDWLKKPDFVKVLRSRKREALQASMNLLQAASLELASNLVKLAKTAPDPADKIRSTIAALKMAQEQAVNDEIVSRLDAIEASRNAGPTNGPTFTRIKAGAQ